MSGFNQTKSTMEKRLQKEIKRMMEDLPPGVTLNTHNLNSTLSECIVDIEGAPDTLYERERFQLEFKFTNRYPFLPPQVMFIGPNIPVNPHVYSNGHICMSTLSEDWEPFLTISTVCLSIISMLFSCKEKKRPVDDIIYVATCSKDPTKTKWWYHDNSV
ncbi:ubiquitin-conjugating enzyme e2 w [Plakobranchus ocellatus]|uniref:N-terminal E2 ubiquitin-conjugating enzyme n=1 Tax=Plakobranchus ocellatus TaxID=259542 RepID=A0AAV3YAK1_9GAST|nr:ubiquitin-conjugating enzyme e2 w [Plakobranchus ocellatus]